MAFSLCRTLSSPLVTAMASTELAIKVDKTTIAEIKTDYAMDPWCKNLIEASML